MAKLTKEEKEFIKRVKERKETKGGSYVLSKRNNIYHGIPFGVSRWIHGEENAIGAMVTKEGLNSKFKIVLIVGYPKRMVMPCGMCRVAIHKYGTKNSSVLCSNKSLSKIKKFKISELYPHPYEE